MRKKLYFIKLSTNMYSLSKSVALYVNFKRKCRRYTKVQDAQKTALASSERHAHRVVGSVVYKERAELTRGFFPNETPSRVEPSNKSVR